MLLEKQDGKNNIWYYQTVIVLSERQPPLPLQNIPTQQEKEVHHAHGKQDGENNFQVDPQCNLYFVRHTQDK